MEECFSLRAGAAAPALPTIEGSLTVMCGGSPLKRQIVPRAEGCAKWYVTWPNKALSASKGALWPHGADPPHIRMNAGKIGTRCKICGSHQTQVGFGLNGLQETAGHLRSTP